MAKLNVSPQSGKQNTEIISVQVSKDIIVQLRPDAAHTFLMTTQQVAEGFGVTDKAIREQKRRNIDEFKEGKHFLPCATNRGSFGQVSLGFLDSY